MILLIDNYDSFTYNLYQYMGIFEKDIKVVRNDKITIEEIEQLNPNRIVLSPTEKSERSRNLYGRSKTFLHEKTNPWHLPGTSEHRSRIWSKNHSCKRTDAWKTVVNRTRWKERF